jgi:hypothetical protein
MIKLLLFLFTITLGYGEEHLFYFPDHHARSIHFLNDSIKNSTSVLIITPSYAHNSLSKAMIFAARNGSSIKLILNHPQGEPLRLIQYQNIDLSLTKFPLLHTIILINKQLLCTTESALDEEIFSSQHSSMRCTSEPKSLQSLQPLLALTQKRSEPYLK